MILEMNGLKTVLAAWGNPMLLTFICLLYSNVTMMVLHRCALVPFMTINHIFSPGLLDNVFSLVIANDTCLATDYRVILREKALNTKFPLSLFYSRHMLNFTCFHPKAWREAVVYFARLCTPMVQA